MLAGIEYHAGTVVRGPQLHLASLNGVLVPDSAVAAPIDFAGIYLVLRDYITFPGIEIDPEAIREFVIEQLLSAVSMEHMVVGLSSVLAIWSDSEGQEALTAAFEASLGPDAEARLRAALAPSREQRVLVAKQAVLGAMK